MLSKEEFKKELVRMWDSVRTESKGKLSCEKVSCVGCPMQYINNQLCRGYIDNDCTNIPIECAIDIIEIVEKWSKEHPIVTNKDKFKEMFGINIYDTTHECVGFTCPSISTDCKSCPYNGFWSREYKEPKESEEEI